MNTIQSAYDYQSFLSSPTAKQWQKISLARRAGVSVPLFSLYSKKSIGIGEFPDLRLLSDWCVKTGMSLIQLLPVNDVGFNFTPYDAVSTFALEPMYLCLEEMVETDLKPFAREIADLRKKFPHQGPRVNYGIKKAKLDLLGKIFEVSNSGTSSRFRQFVESASYWLHTYAAYKVFKENYAESRWEDWPEGLRQADPEAVTRNVAARYSRRMQFHSWLQWQLFEQFRAAKEDAARKKVLIMGDLPFLVARDSADVWAHQSYFRLDRVAGAPPDAFFARGQRWGMPPYDWDKIRAHQFDYLIEKIRYAEHFYHFFRIDHVVGMFRVWTIRQDEPRENAGLHGVFDPEDEGRWEAHGKELLNVMIRHAVMLPCAEDLGVVPPCCTRTLEEFAIPGMEVQRWTKNWTGDVPFKAPEQYRKNSMAVVSNHDMTSIAGWWHFEAGTVDGELFERKCAEKGIPFEAVKARLFDLDRSGHGRLRWRSDVSELGKLLGVLGRSENEAWDLAGLYRESYREKEKFLNFVGLEEEPGPKEFSKFVRRVLEKANASASIFSIPLLTDWLSAGDLLSKEDPWDFRINFPGTSGPQNWSLVMPVSLEALNELELNSVIRQINKESGRI